MFVIFNNYKYIIYDNFHSYLSYVKQLKKKKFRILTLDYMLFF